MPKKKDELEGFNEVGKAEAWDYKAEGKGAIIRGFMEDIQTDVGPNHSMLYTLKTSDGQIAVWGSTVLDLRLKNVEVGDEVVIEYLGKEKSEKRKGSEYHNFKVLHRKVEEAEKVEQEDDFDLDLDSISEKIK